MPEESLLRDLAELALEAPSREEFRRRSLDRICRAASMDAGVLGHAASATGIAIATHGLDVERVRPSLPKYLKEISAEERHRVLRGRAVVDAQVFERGRRESLRLYTECLMPAGIFGFCARMWIDPRGCFGVALSREGRAARYRPRDLRVLEAAAPILMIGDALHTGAKVDRARALGPRPVWAREARLTRAERQVADLVERGLTNAEIAPILGRSPNTVRNQLAAVFQKLHVSSRSELVFVLANPDPPQPGCAPAGRGAQ